jgi:hypothetical protein
MTDPATDDLLARVQSLLVEQLAEVRRSRFDAARTISLRIDDLVRQASQRTQVVVDDATRERISSLQSELRLALKQRLSEVGAARDRLSRGKTTLQAYRRGVK